MTNLNFLPPFLLMATQLVLGSYIFFQNPKSKINISFALLCFSIALWNISVYFVLNRSVAGLIFWDKFIFIWSTFVPAFFLYFTIVFPRETKLRFYSHPALLFIAPVILLFLLAAGQIIADIKIVGGQPHPVFGAGYIFFALYFLSYFAAGTYNLISKYRAAHGIEQLQLRYVFLGLFLSLFFPIITSLILPALLGPQYFGLGPYFTLFVIGFTAYAIVRHRLMSIELVVQKGAIYGAISMSVLVLYAAAVYSVGYTSFWVNALAVLILAIAYHPLVRQFQWFTDRFLFKERYGYRKALLEISEKITSVLKLEELARLIVAAFLEKIKVSQVSFLTLDRWKEHFKSIELNMPRYRIIEIDVGNPIIRHLSESNEILVKEEVEDAISGAGKVVPRDLGPLRDSLEKLGTELWIPIVSKGRLIAAVGVGSKVSGEVFSAEDLSLFGLMANQAAVALENASLYQEVLSMKDYSQEILESMVNGVITFDRGSKIITFNYMAEKITGRAAAQVLGKTAEEIWGGKGVITGIIEKTFQGKLSTGLETNLVSPERGLVPVSLTSTLLHDAAGRKIGALLSITDLSDIRTLEEKVRRSDKLEALATMAAGMAHEIKNPLSSLKVFSQLLPAKFEDLSFRKKFQEIVPNEINRIDRIVESLLSFAKATAPNFEMAKIDALLEETLKDYLEQAKTAKVKIAKDFTPLPEVEIDSAQMRQVFSNLILNAIQAMPEGGTLALKTAEGKKENDQVQEIKIEIRDTGHGISTEMKEKLFDPFFTTKHGGTGLGLTIAHSLISGHHGDVTVESEIGKGTAFTVTLPIRQETVPVLSWK